MFDVFYSGIKPNLFVHEQAAQDIDHAQTLSRTRYFWWVNYLTDYTGFDFLWEPVPWQAGQRHAWPSQWQKDAGTYLIPTQGYSETNYRTDYQLARYYDLPRWNIPRGFDVQSFDFSWHPDPTEPGYIYQFGTQWQRTGGPTYHVPGASEIKYVDQPRTTKTTRDPCWTVPPGASADSFDWTWHPDANDPPYIYQFGTQWQRTGGPVYQVPGASEIKYVDQPRTTKTTRDSHWTVPPGANLDSFDWTWHPDANDPPYIYQFGTQWQRTGGPVYQVPGATEIKYVDQLRIRTSRVATAVYEIDHLDGHAGKIPDTTKTVRYFDNYLDTLRRLAKSIPEEHEFVWICSSICDYGTFDFSWHPEQWQANMLHVFASDGGKFGDTFFMHVPTFRYRADQIKLLDWYDINFVGMSVPRRPLPMVHHDYDCHVEAIKNLDWPGPLAIFTTGKTVESVPPVPLWREKTKTVVPLSAGASQVIVPKTAVPSIKTQVYDYAYIDRTQRHMYPDQPLDIVFIDNGEPHAEYNYLQLPHVTVPNQIHRSSGVTGRVAAYQAAARLSTTPWFFAVFAKLETDETFDWAWQPDRLQEPKHYIFHALNPVNGLVYGHQAMIAYNKKLVLNNPGIGLDFTLDSAHEVVPVSSGIAYYNHSPWMAWRTAFRECIKLRHSLPDVENEYRLKRWCSDGHGVNAEWSTWGALDAVDYYDAVGGDFAELKKSYDWAWLSSYAFLKRNLVPDQ
jgi:hypothetical protein